MHWYAHSTESNFDDLLGESNRVHVVARVPEQFVYRMAVDASVLHMSSVSFVVPDVFCDPLLKKDAILQRLFSSVHFVHCFTSLTRRYHLIYLFRSNTEIGFSELSLVVSTV